ncbi:MAG: hypothetical protein XD84_1725 [Desulfotomaculum sp. 46_80]|nr:MAG: hypothetical protein XD84_1725 [Desulfotomaculum sp. 46_80]
MTTLFLSWAIVIIAVFSIVFFWVRKNRLKAAGQSQVEEMNRFLADLKEEFSSELTPSGPLPDYQFPKEELPHSYGIDRLVLLARDPYWLYAYWEVTATKMAEFSSIHGAWEASWPVLRVYDVTGITFNGQNANQYIDIGINDQANNWHINTGEPDRTFCVDLGRQFPDGRFITLLRSNMVTTPRASLSDREDEEWMWIEGIYRSIRHQYGISSPLFAEEIAERARIIPLGVSSPGHWPEY